MASFGMMNPAYFVGKNILIDFVNNFLEINIDKVEQCANGAIYCNLWDALHPGSIPMSRVDFTVKHDYEFTKNWKLLQNAFLKLGIEKVIPVQRLIKARYQDNLEFLQWMYKYARDTYSGDPDEPTYDALGRRNKSKGGKDYTGSKNNNRRRGKENSSSNSRYNRPTSASNNSRNYKSYRGGSGSNSGTHSQRGSITQNNKGQRGAHSNKNNNRGNNNNNNNNANTRELEELRNENKRLTSEKDALQVKFDGLQSEHDELSNIAKDIEKERDFYFNKVVSIEMILKKESAQESPLMKSIYELLYQTEEDKENGNGNGDETGNNGNGNSNNDAQGQMGQIGGMSGDIGVNQNEIMNNMNMAPTLNNPF